MLGVAKWLFLVVGCSLVALQSHGQEPSILPNGNEPLPGEDARQGRDLLDWIGLGTGPDTDPYLSKTNAACLNGDLAECFKSRALASLDDFFNQASYGLTENARILRMPVNQLRQLQQEPFEYSSAPRADEPEWDQLVKFVLRKVEKFLKSTAVEVQFPDEVTEQGRYKPRFIDEIAGEVDIIEDKKDSLFKRNHLKKLIIPLLLVLKVFKLKLLLFLPLILGLASFKKLLGFMALAIPGIIGFYKFCKPDLHAHPGQFYNRPHYSPAGIGPASFHHPPHFKEEYASSPDGSYYGGGYGGSHGYSGASSGASSGGLTFRDDPHNAQNLAYSGYSHYRNGGSGKEDEREGRNAQETSSKKSILPDS